MGTLDAVEKELSAIRTVIGTVSDLEPASRIKVLAYVNSHFHSALPVAAAAASGPGGDAPAMVAPPNGEIPGIAVVSPSGDLRLTIRGNDLKAKSGLDAAVRLAHVVIYANEKLLGIPVSSPKVLTPILKEWRLYDSNTRKRLARERGIVRTGDSLSLDTHARVLAERFISEIQDPNTKGAWRP